MFALHSFVLRAPVRRALYIALIAFAAACADPPPEDDGSTVNEGDTGVADSNIGLDTTTAKDSGSAVEDTGNTAKDAGSTAKDAGSTVKDAGSTVKDAGGGENDVATPKDAGGGTKDASGTKDAATTGADADTPDAAAKPDVGGGADAGGGADVPCVKTNPPTEICDGIDNDCDGKIDNKTCQDGNSCTSGFCQKKGAQFACVFTAETGACDDGNPCTKDETCKNKLCVASPPCDDGNACTKDVCDAKAGTCSNAAVADGTGCGSGKKCLTGKCVIASGCAGKKDGEVCDDGDGCTEGDTCFKNNCASGKQKKCTDDGSVCTTEFCDPANGQCGAKNDNETKGCDDANKCTLKTTCKTGKCTAGESLTCKDTNPCTVDSCDANQGCKFKPATDGVSCGKGMACTAGKCMKIPACSGKADGTKCEDGTACTQGDVCKGGKCVAGKPLDCNDGNDCTVDTCSAAKGCQHVAAANGAKCEDGEKCTTGDTCSGGKCQAGKNTCPATCGDNKCTTGETCGNCTKDCGVCVGAAPVTFALAKGSPGRLTGAVNKGKGANQFNQGMLALSSQPPATSGTVWANVGGPNGISGSAGFTTRALPAAWVRAIYRTSHVYADARDVRVVVQVRDARGNAKVESGTKATLTVAYKTSKQTASCFVGPTGTCNIATKLPSSWFKVGVAGDAQASVTVGKLQPIAGKISVHAIPKYSAPPAKGMELTIPIGPRLAGTTFTAELWAYTGTEVLESFDAAISFDPKVVKAIAANLDGKYTGAKNVKADKVLLVAVREGKVKPAQVTGKVRVGVITFRVNPAAAALAKGNITGTINAMFNVQNVKLVDKGTAVGIKSGTGTGNSGFVVVQANPILGIYAFAAKAEVVNTAPLTGADVVVPIKTFEVRAALPDKAAKPTCQSGNAKVMTKDAACNAVFNASMKLGAKKLSMSLKLGNHKASVPFRVWAPTAAKVMLDRSTLAPVEGFFADCTAKKHAPVRTRVNVSATFTDGAAKWTGWVNDWAKLKSSSKAVASVDKGWVVGHAPGSADIMLDGGTLKATAKFTLSKTPTKATGLTVVALNGIGVSVAPAPASALAVDKPATAHAVLQQKLHAEFATAKVMAWVKTADGHRQPVTEAMGLGIKTLDKNIIDTMDKPLRIKALGTGEGMYVEGTWTVCKKPLATGKGAVKVKLPPPTGATISVNEPRIAWKKTDPAAVAGVAAFSGSVIILKYANGTKKQFTNDPRVVWDAKSMDPKDLFIVQLAKDKAGKITGVSIVPTGKGVGKASVKVTFKHAPKISASAVVNVVKHEKFGFVAHPWPSYSGSSNVVKTKLNKLEKTATWQQAVLDLDSHLTDGFVIDVSTRKATTYTTYKAGTKTVDKSVLGINAAVVKVLKAGVIDIRANFAGAGSQPLKLTAEDKPVNVKSLKVSTVPTFSGFKGQAKTQTKVWATFADGTQLDALKVPGLLSFSSNATKKVSINAKSGLATLLDNHNRPVTLSAKAVSSGVVGSVKTAANLVPVVGDIDLGQKAGVPHPDVKPGQSFIMPLRVNTGSQSLGSIDVTVTYDKDVLQAVKGESGSGWPGGQFDVTVNDPPGKVQVVGAAKAGSTAKGAHLEVARLHFKGIKKSGKNVTNIAGAITKLLENTTAQKPIGPNLGPGQTRAIVAGAGLLDPPCAGGQKPDAFIGNANGDCEFSVGDVSYVLFYLADKLNKGSLQPFQKKFMDADGNGDINVADAVYLLRVLAGKFRFVTLTATPGVGGAGTLSVKLVDKAGKPVTKQAKVYLHIQLKDSKPTWQKGKLVATTKEGPVVEAVHVGGGVYTVVMGNMKGTETSIGVAVIIKTSDALGQGANDRAVALHGSPWLSKLSKFAPATTFKIGQAGGPKCKKHTECDDKNACTEDICDSSKGVCINKLKPDPKCQGAQKCTKHADCDDKKQCTKDVCDATTGTCKNSSDASIPGCGKVCKTDAECDDKEGCTIDKCTNGKCTNVNNDKLPGCSKVGCKTAKDCDDKNVCTLNVCDAKGECQYPKDPNAKDPTCGGSGKACTQAGQCDDSDSCTIDTCDSGKCVNFKLPDKCGAQKKCKTAAECDDSNKCTKDTCAAGFCSNQPLFGTQGCGCQFNNHCNDNNKCTLDTCESKKCVFKPDNNAPGCSACKQNVDCDDKDKCTVDTCDAGKCQHVKDGKDPSCQASCKVGDPKACASGKFCQGACGGAGQCVDKPKTCKAGSVVCGCDHKEYASSCLAQQAGMDVKKDGKCGAIQKCTKDVECVDSEKCTKDICVNGACKHTLDKTVAGCSAGGGGPCTTVKDCDDKNICTIDKCEKGKCINFPGGADPSCQGGKPCQKVADCNDNNDCTIDACTSNKCAYKASTDPKCQVSDKCIADKDCNDLNMCTDNKCVKNECKFPVKTGCVPHEKCTKPIDCDDKDACTVEACTSGKCAWTKSTALQCLPTKACTIGKGECGTKMFCKATTVGACTGSGICTVKPAVCAPQSAKVCACGDKIYDNACLAAKTGINVKSSGECPKKACTTDAQCDDKDGCTKDACQAGLCSHTQDTKKQGCAAKKCQTSAECDDQDKCTTDTCSAGTCKNAVNQSIPGCKIECKVNTDCNDSKVCTIDSCTAGKCNHAIDVKNAQCVAKSCTNDEACMDMNICTIDNCNSSGKCVYTTNTKESGCGTGKAPDACATSKDCLHPTKKCQFGSCFNKKCIYQEIKVCLAALCSANKDCADTDPCTEDKCNDGRCVNLKKPNCTIKKCQTASECDDKDPCTKDSCASNICKHDKDATCGGAKTCTIGKFGECPATDYCKASTAGACQGSGVCVKRPLTCGNDFAKVCDCNGTTHTNACMAAKIGANVKSSGQCQQAWFCTNDQMCDDKKACTVDKCNTTKKECTWTQKAGCNIKKCVQDGDCDDKDKCTVDSCMGGTCSHFKIQGPGCGAANGCTINAECDDKKACTIDKCENGLCTNKDDPKNPCGGQSQCNSNADCKDGKDCTADKCTAGKCSNPINPNIPGCAGGGGKTCKIGVSGSCAAGQTCMGKPGACSGDGQCTPQQATCPPDNFKVCGCDNKTYNGMCLAIKAGVAIKAEKACN